MKIKSFLTLLAAGLLSVASFSACNDDAGASELHFYELIAALTDPGSMTASEIRVSEAALDHLENSYNAELATLPLSSADAREMLRQIATELRGATEGSGGDLTRAVVYTVSMKNRSTGETEHTETITIRPGK